MWSKQFNLNWCKQTFFSFSNITAVEYQSPTVIGENDKLGRNKSIPNLSWILVETNNKLKVNVLNSN